MAQTLRFKTRVGKYIVAGVIDSKAPRSQKPTKWQVREGKTIWAEENDANKAYDIAFKLSAK